MRFQPFTVAVLAVAVEQVHAWGAAGHEITATIAQMYLHPSVLPRICAIVNPSQEPDRDDPPLCHLAPLATWADRIRGLAQYRWAGPFHYVGGLGDYPPSDCRFGETGWEGQDGINVLGGIWNTTNWLREGRPRAAEATKFLIHFIGDLHMPLHLTARDRGGNDVKVRFHRRLTNLHSVWDSRLISNSILDTPGNYSHPLPSPEVEGALRGSIYDPLIRSIVWEGLLQSWKDDLDEWISCPSSSSSSSFMSAQESGQVPLFSSTGSDTDTGRWDDDFVCPHFWAKPTQALNCEVVWPFLFAHEPKTGEPHEIIELDTPQYAGKVRKDRLVEKLLAQAGIRMAAVLNGLFADEDELKDAKSGYRIYAPLVAA